MRFPEPDECSPHYRIVSLGFILILSFYLRINLRTVPFPSRFPTTILHFFFLLHIHDKFPGRLILDLVILIGNRFTGQRVQITKLSIFNFFQLLLVAFFYIQIFFLALCSQTQICILARQRSSFAPIQKNR